MKSSLMRGCDRRGLRFATHLLEVAVRTVVTQFCFSSSFCSVLLPVSAFPQGDEIQVYDGGLAPVGVLI